MTWCPRPRTIALLIDPDNSIADAYFAAGERAARALGIPVVAVRVGKPSDLEAAVGTAAAEAGALVVTTDAMFSAERARISAFAAAKALPTIDYNRAFPDIPGGLASYGGSIAEAYYLAARDVGRILKGEKPGDLPIDRSTKFELVINLKDREGAGPRYLARDAASRRRRHRVTPPSSRSEALRPTNWASCAVAATETA